MDAEFVGSTGLIIAELNIRTARLSAVCPRDPRGCDGIRTRIPGHVDQYLYPRKAREGRQQAQPVMRAKSAFRQWGVRPVNEMRVGYREIVFVEEGLPQRHPRFEPVGLDQDAVTLAALEGRRQHDVQKWMARPRADPALCRGVSMCQQKTCILIDPQIERNVEPSTADFAEALQAFKRLPAPEGTVFGEEIIGADFVCDPQPSRQRDIP